MSILNNNFFQGLALVIVGVSITTIFGAIPLSASISGAGIIGGIIIAFGGLWWWTRADHFPWQ